MSKGPHRFPSTADVEKAVKAAAASGKDWRVIITDGKIELVPAGDDDEKANEWDSVK